MSKTALTNKKIEKVFSTIISGLSQKENLVIKKRVGLNHERQTLQSIGDSFNPSITRERVRQIEDSGISKIGRVLKSSELALIQKTAMEFLSLNGGLITKESVINHLIKTLKLSSDVNQYIIETIIQADFDVLKSKPKLGTKSYFYYPKINNKTITKSLIEKIHKEALKVLKRKKDVINKNDLYNTIKENLKEDNFEMVFIKNVLDIFEDIVTGENDLIGLTKWKILNPKTLKDKAVYVMKKEKIPMHFIDITNKISEYMGETVKVNTIHNELIRNKDFVLIGRGLYALKEWGFKSGTVIDVICDILKKSKEAMSTEDIIKGVLKVRNVKKTTIYMNLQNKGLIERVGRNYYQLKSK